MTMLNVDVLYFRYGGLPSLHAGSEPSLHPALVQSTPAQLDVVAINGEPAKAERLSLALLASHVAVISPQGTSIFSAYIEIFM